MIIIKRLSAEACVLEARGAQQILGSSNFTQRENILIENSSPKRMLIFVFDSTCIALFDCLIEIYLDGLRICFTREVCILFFHIIILS